MNEQTTMTADEINRAIELRLFNDDLTAKTDEQIDSAIAYRRAPRDFTTPDGMMLVLKAMRDLGYGISINDVHDEYVCEFIIRGPVPIRWWNATADDVPTAVARAALAALEAKSEER